MRKGCVYLFLALALTLTASSPAQVSPEAAIRQLLDQQSADWNRGDVEAFMKGYEDSPTTTFVGRTVQYGYATILKRYKKLYTTRAAMGKLTFSCNQHPGCRLRRGHGELSFRANRGRRRQCQRHFLPTLQTGLIGLEDYSGPHQPGRLMLRSAALLSLYCGTSLPCAGSHRP
jgi:hypothetical protein